jgi:ABC-type hemin transport system substrate-binding protein
MLRRIVSLVPSVSETLAEWGLAPELVACTKFCVRPKGLRRTTQIVGGTKDFSVAEVLKLNPTHVIVNQEENTRLLVEELAKSTDLLLTFPKSPLDVAKMLRDIGSFLNCTSIANASATEIEDIIERLKSKPRHAKKFLYLIWRQPYMAAGRDTYISRLLELAGWINAYEGDERYPVLSLEQLKGIAASSVFLSSEPYPFRKRDAVSLRNEWHEVPDIFKVDGQLLSWHGVSSLRALRALDLSQGEIAGILGNSI